MIDLYDMANQLNFLPIESLKNYYDKKRFYHNDNHIKTMWKFIGEKLKYYSLTDYEIQLVYVAILFHDIIYKAGSQTNEYDSWIECRDNCLLSKTYDDEDSLKKLEEMIMATKTHTYSDELPDYVKIIIRADLDGFCSEDFNYVWNNNIAIFKEFQCFDWSLFKKGQIDFLVGLKARIANWMPGVALWNIDKIVQTLSVWEPKIAVYPGSFNPFHIGHLNILEKAEKIFDKVIIARGINHEKTPESIQNLTELKTINNRQFDEFEGLLTDYIATKEYPVTIIRGLRNTTDMAYEQNTYRWLQDLNPEVNVVSLFCDKEYEHVSSSGIRLMKKFDKQAKYLVK